MKLISIRYKWMLLFLLLVSLPGQAEVTLPAIVGNGMILQRDETIKVWGWARKGEKVRIRFAGKSYSTTTGTNGKWRVELAPMGAGGPFTMEIKGSNKIILDNILIGDVWVCSGQSNMTHYLGRHAERYAKEIAEASYPAIRQFFVPDKAVLAGPIEDIPGQKWVAADPRTVLDFTVIGYFFALKLHEKYHVPMGIINTCVGGTPIETWISEKGFKEFPEILEKIKQNKDTAYVNGLARQAAHSLS